MMVNMTQKTADTMATTTPAELRHSAAQESANFSDIRNFTILNESKQTRYEEVKRPQQSAFKEPKVLTTVNVSAPEPTYQTLLKNSASPKKV